MNNNIIKRYVLDSNGNQKGVVIGRLDKENNRNVFKVGWSMANLSLGDKYDKQNGNRIAFNRIDRPSNRTVPYEVWEVIQWLEGSLMEICQNDNFVTSISGSKISQRPAIF